MEAKGENVMAGPKEKQGLEYFPHDVDLSIDEKIQLVESEHGLLGYAVFCKLLERIYRHGFYIHADEKFIKLFSRTNGVDFSICKNIIDCCISEGLFDKKIYGKWEVLTSKGIQERYIKIVERRKRIDLILEYLLINVNGNDKNTNIISINVDSNGQSKVKESKGKESKEILSPIGEFKNVLLSDEERQKLIAQFGESGANDRIEKLSGYIASKGKKYKSHYATILTWARKEPEYGHKKDDNGDAPNFFELYPREGNNQPDG